MRTLQTFGFLIFIEMCALIPHIDKAEETKYLAAALIMMGAAFLTIIGSDRQAHDHKDDT